MNIRKQKQHVGPIELGVASGSSVTYRLAEVAFRTNDVKKLRTFLLSKGLSPGELGKCADDPCINLIDPEDHRLMFVASPAEPRIIHAGFIVHDRAATEHFYKDILGFRPYWHGGMKDDQTDWVSMQVPDGTDWLEFMVNVEPDADQRLRGIMNHIAIGVPDIHAVEKKLTENGVKLTEQPQIGRDGKWQLNLYDPDDTRVELMEFTPVQKPCCSEYTGPHPKP
jgi:catechol 2,3-dioxygenase-like lactoylglutathione lyase family enzyme